MNIEYV